MTSTTWGRLTESRLTIAFVSLTLLHLIIQTILASGSLYINNHTSNALQNIYRSQNLSYSGYASYNTEAETLRVCETNDQLRNVSLCQIIWPPSLHINASHPKGYGGIHFQKREKIAQKMAQKQITLNLPVVSDNLTKQGQNSTFRATETCLQALRWPLQTILQKQREDLTFIFLQIWIFVLGIAAVTNNSVPHILASCIGHISITIWTAIQLVNVFAFKQNYDTLIKGVNTARLGLSGQFGACEKQDPIPQYFQHQILGHLLLIGWNTFGFIGFLFFAYKLHRSFAWSTFKRIGASILIERLYRMALTHLLFLQITLYFVVVSVVLWIDQLSFGAIASKAPKKSLYLLLSFIALGIIVPWLILGAISVQREMRKSMFFYILLTFLFVVGWFIQSLSLSWRLTYQYWPFFAVIETISLIFIAVSLVVGILARIFCFGKGLPQYLRPIDHVDNDDLNAAPDVIEGFEPVNFPSREPLGDEEQGRIPRSTSGGSQSRARQLHRSDSDATLTDPHASKTEGLKPKKEDLEDIVEVPLASATRAWNAQE
ncbi:hypothetical protein FRC16_008627 [Serendipita sp. 398]|nr:hypothetical protein FRC16_008627 [Serendipita sp. 398]